VIALAAIALLLLLDMQNVGARRRRVEQPTSERSGDFTIVVPLYGAPRFFANREALEPFKQHTLLVVSTAAAAMEAFARELEEEGWRVHRTSADGPLPALVAAGLGSVRTTWAIRLDGDATFVDDPGSIVAAAAAADADICSVKIVPSQSESLVEKLQTVEYATAMLSRHHRPWLTSGACIVGRTSSLRAVLALHSNWFLGEDIETGAIARRLRMRVVHIDAAVRTVVPATVADLFHQRRIWWAGCFRQTWINLDHGWDDPLALVYRVALVWALYLGKSEALVHAWRLLPIIVVAYTGITLASNWSARSRWMILYPYYALVQSLVMPAIGTLEYVRIAMRRRSLGRYRMPLRRSRSYDLASFQSSPLPTSTASGGSSG
jgi:Glycosyl transferase family group 2